MSERKSRSKNQTAGKNKVIRKTKDRPVTRVSVTLDEDTLKMVDAQAHKRDMSRNEWLGWAVDSAIKSSVGQYALSGLVSGRISELTDKMVQQETAFNNLSDTITSMIHMLDTLIGGDSYLNDADQNGDEEE